MVVVLEQNLPILTMPQEQVQLWLLSGFGCPHAEQNLPVLIVPQEQVQPWLLSGFGCPHAEQNLPVLTVPQEQVQFWLLPGFGFPQAEQNFPVLTVPQEQVQPWLLSGFGCPHPEQNLPVLTVPQAQVQLPAAAWVFCICAALVAEAASIKLPPAALRLILDGLYFTCITWYPAGFAILITVLKLETMFLRFPCAAMGQDQPFITAFRRRYRR